MTYRILTVVSGVRTAWLSSYDGADVGEYRGWFITESTHRPPSCRFEASQGDGEPSQFAGSLVGLLAYINMIEDDDEVHHSH